MLRDLQAISAQLSRLREDAEALAKGDNLRTAVRYTFIPGILAATIEALQEAIDELK
jgi:hypothetical protein